mmetsp:Transcript_4654/g.13031  ORF Transcript_4654/g.13031 Transcript_4654/m.13031 type:complete len:182 (-) Transcript_4654:576-1121(-)
MKRRKGEGDDEEEEIKPMTTEEQRKVIAELEEANAKTHFRYRTVTASLCSIAAIVKIVTQCLAVNDGMRIRIYRASGLDLTVATMMEFCSILGFALTAALFGEIETKAFQTRTVLLVCVGLLSLNLLMLGVYAITDPVVIVWFLGLNVAALVLAVYFDSVARRTSKEISQLENYVYDLKSV